MFSQMNVSRAKSRGLLDEKKGGGEGGGGTAVINDYSKESCDFFLPIIKRMRCPRSAENGYT